MPTKSEIERDLARQLQALREVESAARLLLGVHYYLPAANPQWNSLRVALADPALWPKSA